MYPIQVAREHAAVAADWEYGEIPPPPPPPPAERSRRGRRDPATATAPPAAPLARSLRERANLATVPAPQPEPTAGIIDGRRRYDGVVAKKGSSYGCAGGSG